MNIKLQKLIKKYNIDGVSVDIFPLTFSQVGRETKKPLDASERGEWKSWLKAQHSEN